jgi:TRAP-type C4-dicarboxylate transport system permease small subunit
MRFPVPLRKFNKALGAIAGVLLLAIAFLAVMESLLRTIFVSPTKWSADLSSYFLLIAIFLGAGYAYQEKGHVGVELFRDMVEKRWSRRPRRGMAVAGYILSFVVIIATLIGVYKLLMPALEVNQTTFANIPIPISLLYAVMIAGSLIMAVTVFFILLDLFKGEDDYM